MQKCMNCMEDYEDSLRFCSNCGYMKDSQYQKGSSIPPETILKGRYIIGRVIHTDKIGFTYVAWDALLERRAAVKEFFPELLAERAEDGIHILYQEQSEHSAKALVQQFLALSQRLHKMQDVKQIVPVFEFFSENNTGYYVMEYLKGNTLQDLLQRENPMEENQACKIAGEIFSGVNCLRHKIDFHGNLTPENIFITNSGEFKFLNFAWFSDEIKEMNYFLFQSNYAPPELYKGGEGTEVFSDPYSLYCIVYRMITGIEPMSAIDRMKRYKQIWPREYGIEISPEVENLLKKGMNMDPSKRQISEEQRVQGFSVLKDGAKGKSAGRDLSGISDNYLVYKLVLSFLALIAIILGILLLL